MNRTITTFRPGKGAAKPKQPVSLFLRPTRALASCIYGAFVRDTRGCNLVGKDQMNHFAASPLCAVSWCFEGSYSLITSAADGEIQKEPLPRISFSGAQTGPRTSLNESELYGMTVAFYPDAFRKFTGVEAGRFLDKTVPAESVLPLDFLVLAQKIMELRSAEEGFQLLCRHLEEKGQGQQHREKQLINSISNWAYALLEQAPKSGFGKSIRQIERRIKDWTGHTKRDLEFYAKVEQSFELANRYAKTGEVVPAEIAVEAGYSDQSHMGRNVKRMTGHSPRDLLWRIENEEAYWSYRLIGGIERASQ